MKNPGSDYSRESDGYSVRDLRSSNLYQVRKNSRRTFEQVCFINIDPAATFKNLRVEWLREAGAMDSVEDMVQLRPYQWIIGMGETALPYILKDLKESPNFWFYALECITRHNPVAISQRSDFEASVEAWLEWGERNGILTDGSSRTMAN